VDASLGIPIILPLVVAMYEPVPLLLCPVSGVSESANSLSKCFRSVSQQPSSQLGHMVFGSVFHIRCLGGVNRIHLEGSVVISRGDGVRVVIVC